MTRVVLKLRSTRVAATVATVCELARRGVDPEEVKIGRRITR